MKEVQELTVTVVDFGSFISLAEKISETCKCNYYSPIEREFRSIDDATIGYGIPGVTKLNSFMHPDIVKETDLFVFPDIGYSGEQALLRDMGKPVWGSAGGDVLERLRTRFIKTVEDLGLPVAHSERIKGLTALCDYLKERDNLWIKVNEFRDNMETWHHQDYEHSLPELAHLSVTFGGMADEVWFVAQEVIDDATEIGYDGWSIDGWFPDSSYQGYEKKNELYLGARTPYDNLPKEVRVVNEAWSKVLKEFGFRNFFATEIRNKEGVPYFIDPTQRMPGQTGEQLLETLDNIVEVIWQGAQGNVIQPKWNADFAASATLNYKGGVDGWKVVKVKDSAKRWAKLNRFGIRKGICHFPPNKRSDVGVVIALGNTIEETIAGVKENFEAIGDEGLSIQFEGFIDLLESIHKAEKEGIEFTPKRVPEPEIVLATNGES